MIAAVVALAAALTATDPATDMTFTLSGRTLTAGSSTWMIFPASCSTREYAVKTASAFPELPYCRAMEMFSSICGCAAIGRRPR